MKTQPRCSKCNNLMPTLRRSFDTSRQVVVKERITAPLFTQGGKPIHVMCAVKAGGRFRI